jgi:hypothetical protein
MSKNIPDEIRQFATQLCNTFGSGVKLLHWADNRGNSQGKPENDDPGATLRSTEWETR